MPVFHSSLLQNLIALFKCQPDAELYTCHVLMLIKSLQFKQQLERVQTFLSHIILSERMCVLYPADWSTVTPCAYVRVCTGVNRDMLLAISIVGLEVSFCIFKFWNMIFN
jgi:hypothetical protein